MSAAVYFCQKQDRFYADHICYDLPGDFRFVPHTHEMCELLFIKSGCVSYITEGKHYSLRKNSLVFIRPACIHQLRIEGKEPYERYDLLCDLPSLLPRLYGLLPKDLDVVDFHDNPRVIDLFQKMDLYHQKFSPEDFHRLVLLLLEELLYNTLIASPQQTLQRGVSDNPLIRQAVAYMEAHIAEPLTVEDVCGALYITKSHLHHLFNRYMQITPKKYILSKRLTLSQIAIRSGKKPTEVYSQYGFQNYATFYRAYCNHFGYRPSDEPTQSSNWDNHA